MRLESDVHHIQTDVSDIKIDLRDIRKEFHHDIEGLNTKIDNFHQTSIAKFDTIEKSIASIRIRGLLLCGTVATFLLGALAAGFLVLTARDNELSDKLSGLSSDVAALTVNVTNLTATVNVLSGDVKALAAGQGALSADVKTLATGQTTIVKRLDAIDAALAKR